MEAGWFRPGVDVVLVALGGAAGGALRFWVSALVAHRMGERFPWGTLAVNASGAGVLGLLAGAGASAEDVETLWLLIAVGGVGSYTTVSSFSLQTLALLRRGRWRSAASNLVLSFALCLGGAGGGYSLARTVVGS